MSSVCETLAKNISFEDRLGHVIDELVAMMLIAKSTNNMIQLRHAISQLKDIDTSKEAGA